jgi:type I restriction-modification system DNA methylase subunit
VDSALARAKAGRATKQMLGQFMTPTDLAQQVTEASEIKWTKDMIVLEPGFGKGAFLFQALEGLIKAHGSTSKKVIQHIFRKQLFGVEMDPQLYDIILSMRTSSRQDTSTTTLI